LVRRIAEVEAWTARHPTLRHPDLTPSLEEFPKLDALASAVERLSARRAELLGGATPSAEGAGGRLLVCEYQVSLCSGESEGDSDGFYDINDRPPWDLWIATGKQPASAGMIVADPADALFAWVPAEFVARAQAGIDANPYECIYWLRDVPNFLTS
jgi:hypothetical protein